MAFRRQEGPRRLGAWTPRQGRIDFPRTLISQISPLHTQTLSQENYHQLALVLSDVQKVLTLTMSSSEYL